MTYLPFATNSIRFEKLSRFLLIPLILPILAIAPLLTAGCEAKHIGRPCDLGPVNQTDPKVLSVNPQALECPSRTCVLPDKSKNTDTGPLCTDQCQSDDDCLAGETGSGAGDPRCDSRFVCRTLSSQGALACRAVCVCFDFLLSDDAATVPPACVKQ